jgi:hypothetical protein
MAQAETKTLRMIEHLRVSQGIRKLRYKGLRGGGSIERCFYYLAIDEEQRTARRRI